MTPLDGQMIDHERHMEAARLLSEISAWKGLAKELHGLLCEAVEWNWLDEDGAETIPPYAAIMERVNEVWDDPASTLRSGIIECGECGEEFTGVYCPCSYKVEDDAPA